MVPVLFTFHIQGVLKSKKNNSGAKKLIIVDARCKHEESSYHIDESVLSNPEDKSLPCRHVAACSFDNALSFLSCSVSSDFAIAAGCEGYRVC